MFISIKTHIILLLIVVMLLPFVLLRIEGVFRDVTGI